MDHMEIKICKNILKLRKEQQLTQAQVAEYLGVSPQAVSKWEVEAAVPDVYLLPKIAYLFDVSLDMLFGTSNIKHAELLVSKYILINSDKNYKEAIEAVDTLLNLDSRDMKALSLLCKIEHNKAFEYLEKSRSACDRLLDVSKGVDKNWENSAKVQLIRFKNLFGEYTYLDDYMTAFELSGSVEDFNYLLIALGQSHQYQETLRWGETYIDHFSEEEKQLVYPNLMNASVMLNNKTLSIELFEKIIRHNKEVPQVFNAWWLKWLLHTKLGDALEAETCKDELLKQIHHQGYNDFTLERLKNRLLGKSVQNYNVL
jgi:transcriptional regulator with XRE-family HTH domain